LGYPADNLFGVTRKTMTTYTLTTTDHIASAGVGFGTPKMRATDAGRDLTSALVRRSTA